MHIVVIIPTYNEKVNIKNLIPVLQTEVFPKIKGYEMSILVADDGSPDGTQGVVEGFVKEYKNVHLLEGKKEGLGKAYARAMRYAMDILHADAVLEFDADFQHDPHDIPRLIAALDKGADYVIGSRYIKGGQIPKEWGFDRKLKSRLGGLFARYMFLMLNIHDMTSGFKLTKTSFLSKVDLEHLFSYNYAYKMHILHDVDRLGAKVKEVPIIFYERTSGRSKMDTNDIVDSLLVVFRLTLIDFKRVIKFLFVGGTGFILQLTVTYLLSRADIPQNIAAATGGEIAILSNFFLNNAWTFKDTKSLKEKDPLLLRLVKFNTSSLASIIVQYLSVTIAVALLGGRLNIFGFSFFTSVVILFPTIIFLIIPMNYFIYNKFIWKTQYLKNEKS